MKLELSFVKYYRVKRGQKIADIARTFLMPPRVLAAFNDLSEEPQEGQILEIPEGEGNLYLVRGGESKSLLCGSPEAFEKKNRTALFYPMQMIWI